MLDTSHAALNGVAVHRLGNKLRQEGISKSTELLEHSAASEAPLLRFFFNHFRKSEPFKFTHPAGLMQNAMFAIASRIFETESLLQESLKTADHLYEVSDHPKIKAGDFYMALFKNVKYDGKACMALGVFKSDIRATFLKVAIRDGKPSITVNQGTSINDLDKGALILRLLPNDGLRVLPAVSASDDVQYWTEKFLKIVPVGTERAFTKAYLNLCHSYSKELAEDDNTTLSSLFLDRSYQYFKDTETFKENEFLASIGEDIETEKFKAFKVRHEKEIGEIPRSFAVVPAVVRRERRNFQRIIHLDDHAEIKLEASALRSDEKLIEKGFDKKRGQHFYKIYFRKEY